MKIAAVGQVANHEDLRRERLRDEARDELLGPVGREALPSPQSFPRVPAGVEVEQL